ncbi:uncharacterized protein LTR77_007654 [Saxophila tyrrhenica]|uniref:ABC transporter domain-containing protein n=1 Tax=Saxophila tyrrhenica TaxID=1690608 RepID=A0AAV9P6H3_9PEZI|nr:hypothetical protein LTR77_007654 [Saxophila tyrrhenica]
MAFLSQTWTLTKKDLLLVARRSWFTTLLRALVLPIVVTAVLSSVKTINDTNGALGVGTPAPLLSLPEAFKAAGNGRNKFCVVASVQHDDFIDHDLSGNDIHSVIEDISTTFRDAGKTVFRSSTAGSLVQHCPASSKGVTACWGALEFWSSPDKGNGAIWNYTMHTDGSMGSGLDVKSDRNPVQIYNLPLQHAVDSAIARAGGGPQLPDNILQYTFTPMSQRQQDRYDQYDFEALVILALAFALFIGMVGVTYHLTGHITRQREQGMLQLIDAMMPNANRWQCLAARLLSVHLAFDIIYAPGWLIMAGIAPSIMFPESNAGWFVLLYVLTGLGLVGYSILVSSIFRHVQISAISAVIVAMVMALVAQFAESISQTASDTGVIATAVLFPPSAFVYFFIQAAYFEQNIEPLELGVNPDGNYYWNVPAATFLGSLVLSIVLYPVLGAVIERWLHGSSSKNRYLRSAEELGGDAIRLDGFSKRYNVAAKKRGRIQAVDNLSLKVHAGSITVLLGANGSGKSTTLKSIAGLESISGGSIELDGTGGIGLCPQHNVLWDEMTVQEHVFFFQRLKNPALSVDQSKAEVARLISGCDLEIKTNARSKTLSGGQKRKLQLAMMLAGGSQVCCIDEASSGIDPLARRKVWEILLKERGRRTMLLTTHFLDESEVLSDHVAILSKGTLRAEGSVASLKSNYGGGYRVTLPKQDDPLRASEVPASVGRRDDYNDAVYEAADSKALVSLTILLDTHHANYSVHGPTIEDVFIGLSDEMEITNNDLSPADQQLQSDPSSVYPTTRTTKAVSLNSGKGCGPVRQTGILFMKRLTVLKHNYMPYIASLFVPLVLIGMVTRFLLSPEYPNGLPCVKPGQGGISNGFYSWTESLYLQGFAYGPPGDVSQAGLESLIPEGSFVANTVAPINWNRTFPVNSAQELYSEAESLVGSVRAYSVGGIFVGDSENSFTYSSYGSDMSTAVFTQSVLDQVLMDTPIAISTETFAPAFRPYDFKQGIIVVFTVLGFAVYPGFFALYPTIERLRNVRAMHYSNGIMSSSLWAAHALFDSVFVLLVSVSATVIWYACMGPQIYGLGYVFLSVFLFYGMAATAYSYVISLFVPSQLSAIAATSLVQTVIACLFFVGMVVTNNNASAAGATGQFDVIYYTTALVCPAISLFRALLVAMNVYALACKGPTRGSYPGDISLFGAPILYLIIQFILLIAFLMFWESGRSLEVFGIRRKRAAPKEAEMEDFASDKALVGEAMEDAEHMAQSNNGLRVHDVSKTFGQNTAVNKINFGILPSERFALLGPNGAGKSTTISLVRGELHPDSSNPPAEIIISNDSLAHSPVAAKHHLGVCPQFDAVDIMTLSEHLHFYARARGVPDRQHNIDQLVRCLGLTDHTHKLVKKLSGGTKRKLSLAIALISNPSVLLLDEPSSGMDAAAKRALWATLRTVAADRCLLITTHSMEEADALCDRAGIMAGKMLALDSIPRLRARFGDKIYIHLVHKDAPFTSDADTAKLWEWVRATFTVAEAEQRTFGGQVRFAVPARESGDGREVGRLFRVIEGAKGEVGVRDYSVGPTTLDQVFMNVVGRHRVVEENSEAEAQGKRKWWKLR